MRRTLAIIFFAVAFPVLQAAWAAGPGVASKYKILRFPDQTSLGKLYVMAPSLSVAKNMNSLDSLQCLGEAKGTIRVARTANVIMRVGYGLSKYPSYFATCAPDSFAGLIFRYVETDDTTAASLSRLSGLRALDLSQSDLSEQGLKFLSGLRNLEYLDLYVAKFTDQAMSSMTGLSSLTELDIDLTGVSDSGLRYLEQCKHMRRLAARGCRITDVGLPSIAKMTDLHMLQLNENRKITAQGLLSLAPLKKLEVLDVKSIAMTASDLPAIKKLCGQLPALYLITVRDRSFTRAALNEWQKALPHTQVYFDPAK